MIPLAVLAIVFLFVYWLCINGGDAVADPIALSAATLDGLTKTTVLTSASTAYVCDSVLVRSYASATWQLDLTKGVAKRSITVHGWHDGSATVGASNAIWTTAGGGASGTVDVTITCTLTGSGATQALNIVCTPATTGWTANTFRIPLKAIPQ